ncbi:MAG: NAD-glutamate dehydrogenase [Bdellovibrionales bacterium]
MSKRVGKSQTARSGNSSPSGKPTRKTQGGLNNGSSPSSAVSSSSPYPAAPEIFEKIFYADIPQADLSAFQAHDRARIVASIWHLARERARGELKLRLYNPSPARDGWTVDHTVLEIINDDMPFLVESVTGALQRRGLTVHLVIHPLVRLRRSQQGAFQELLGGVSIVNIAALASPSLARVDVSSPPDVTAIGRAITESFIHIQFDHCLDDMTLREIEADVRSVLADARACVEDWPAMRQRMEETIANAQASKLQCGDIAENTEEVKAFLRWIDDNNFVYLGYREVDFECSDDNKLRSIKVRKNSGLGILRDPDVRMFGGMRDIVASKSPELQLYVRQYRILSVAKTCAISRVHRMVPMDALFIRAFNSEGRLMSERLFVGLFTSQSYAQSPREVPFLRRKIENVIAKAGFLPTSHNGRALVHILSNYPHDELFQIAEDELLNNALGILQLQERARVALFVRRDPFKRFATCLIYVPRDRYDSSLRYKFHHLLEATFGGTTENWQVRIDDNPLARAFITIRLRSETYKDPDFKKLESDLRDLCRAWHDRLRDCLAARYGEAAGLALLGRYRRAFLPSYREAVDPARAVNDIQVIERSKATLGERLAVEFELPGADGLYHLKLFQANRPIVLSQALPLIENAGLKVEYMGGPYEVLPRDALKAVYVHDFAARPALSPIVEPHRIKTVFEEAFARIWTGEVENDAFNGLSIRAGMSWREIIVLRCFARYLRQLRIPYSHDMMAATFLTHPELAQRLYALFFARHNPDLQGNRQAVMREIEKPIEEALAKVDALEEDRIIRRYLNLAHASLRTNYFQSDADGACKPSLAIKFDSRAVDFMPLPRPLYEIFIYSPRVEAVHLRGGKVARGGIRWSDRRDDFRNEILGLMKAQMVKNTVIVPVGSKGGFIVKHPSSEPEKHQAEGVACYQTMMRGMLDITDNRVGSKIVPPERVVRHDGDDPYLVVAADKGTASFSDIANAISQERGFWLDDAFASGGSAGYDHKGMGITARGAWEAVKRHFREMGKDIQTTEFTCVGVGDMSGDVFGNGMLLSEHTLLLGAFDHRHIFCDPMPDAAVSYAERKRLFDKPRSSWADYDRAKISKGGGVFARSEKSIKILPEMKKAFGISADSLPPAELIQAMLKAEVELVYFGGIGTYVKASTETHEDVGDRAAEALRIDAKDIRAKVVGEGANLGMTQRGRIEYALRGGRLNTDAIDNSAGVDTSDHEVNIKILLRRVVDRKGLSIKDRNKLLGSMTDEVGELVLRDNIRQTQAISIAESQAAELLPSHVRTIHALETTGLLNCVVEYLPDGHALAERQRTGKGLTRPELAVLLAYAKIWLYEEILASSLPDDAYLERELELYFPAALRKKHADDIEHHQLAREIVATAVTNSVVNRGGCHFVFAMMDRTGQDAVAVARAYLLSRESFRLRDVWQEIDALDNKVSVAAQMRMHRMVQQTLRNVTQRFLNLPDIPTKLAPAMQAYSRDVEALAKWLSKCGGGPACHYKDVESELIAQMVPPVLARRIAMLPALETALDLCRLAEAAKVSLEGAAEAHFALGERLGFDWLSGRAHAASAVAQTSWHREAMAVLLDDLADIRRRLVSQALGVAGGKGKKVSASPAQRLEAWAEAHADDLVRYDTMLHEWRNAGVVDMAMLTLAVRKLGELG